MHDDLPTSERHAPTPIVRPVAPALVDLVSIEKKDTKSAWSSYRLAHDLLSDLDFAIVR